jgi:A/G-specific adenine glycosylase
VTRRLARWYRRAQRDLPWRRTRDPYAIWVSEVMLQQTTVEVVAPRWERFLERFPTVEALARASESAVLAEWSGLGYYARARNLHRAARAVAAAEAFPTTAEGWRALPGIGAYTAAAVSSIAFGAREAVVDGNVVRVLCRLHGLRLDPKAPATLAKLRALAAPLVPARNAGSHNQAVMELGALLCTPRAPRCEVCPLKTLCRAAASGRPETYPRPAARRPTRTLHFVAGIVRRDRKILLVEDREIVRGQLVPPMFAVGRGRRPTSVLRKGWNAVAGRTAGALEAVATLRHTVLERRYRIDLFTFEEISRPSSSSASTRRIFLVRPSDLRRLPHGGLLLKVLAAWRARGAHPRQVSPAA